MGRVRLVADLTARLGRAALVSLDCGAGAFGRPHGLVGQLALARGLMMGPGGLTILQMLIWYLNR